jgi:hypothetical protein
VRTDVLIFIVVGVVAALVLVLLLMSRNPGD